MDVVVGDAVLFGDELFVVGAAHVDAVAGQVEDGVALDAVSLAALLQPQAAPAGVGDPPAHKAAIPGVRKADDAREDAGDAVGSVPKRRLAPVVPFRRQGDVVVHHRQSAEVKVADRVLLSAGNL